MNLEPIRALLESAKAAAVKPTFGDHPDALAFAEMRTTEFAKAAIPALTHLLWIVDGIAKLEQELRMHADTQAWTDHEKYYKDGQSDCADELHRLLHPEDK